MKRIMFICHGNICRSPMAEFIFKKLIEDRGVSKKYYVSSSATSSEEIYMGVGNPVYPPAVKELSKHGIGCEGKRAIQLVKSDYDKYDYLICMDSFNVRNAKRIFGEDIDNKIYKLMDFTQRKGDVADPWYTGDFSTTYNDISEGCKCFIDYLENTDKIS